MCSLASLLSILLLISIPPEASAWTVSKIKGSASLIREGDREAKLAHGMTVGAGDLIQTQRGAKVLLEEEGQHLWIGGGTRFIIEKGKVEQNKPQILNLVYGKVRAIVNKKSAGQYQYRTRTAVAGVRGTEFFFSSDDTQDLFCTLEGSVEVKTNLGDTITVDKGKGLKLTAGGRPSLSDNSQNLVDLWVAQTSVDAPLQMSIDSYGPDRRFHQSGNPNLTYGGFAWMHYCEIRNADFNDAASDKDRRCLSTYLSPFLQYGDKNKIFLRPSINRLDRNFNDTLDAVPSLTGQTATSITLAEAYGEITRSNWSYKLGVQDVEWADGILLSRQLWSTEPKSHLAIRAMGPVRNWNLEVLGGPGIREDRTLNGYSHIKILGIKADAPQNWGSLYALHTNYGKMEPGQSHWYHGHEINHFGIYSTRKINSWDYSFSGIYQKHVIHHDSGGSHDPVEGVMYDVSAGYFFGSSVPMKASIRGIRAGDNFISVMEDYYNLGLSGVIRLRANLLQGRAKFEIEPWENHSFTIEVLKSREKSVTGFWRQLSAATSNGESIGTEVNLIYKGRWRPRWNWLLGLWSFDPGSNLGSDTARGYTGRLEYSY